MSCHTIKILLGIFRHTIKMLLRMVCGLRHAVKYGLWVASCCQIMAGDVKNVCVSPLTEAHPPPPEGEGPSSARLAARRELRKSGSCGPGRGGGAYR